MNLFYFTHAHPRYLPPVLIGETETVCGPCYNNLRQNGTYRFIHTPRGAFDAQPILSKVQAQDLPDVILVHADNTLGCLPTNMPSTCTKVLLVGDTHHLESPIQKMIQYAKSEVFDAIILWNRQHAHFFTELGFPRVYWLPGLNFAVPYTPQTEEKTTELCFFGQLGKHHPRRTRLIQFLKKAKVEIAGGTLPRRESLELVSKSRASLNISLNGEWNLRVFESTQNGALLITDELSEFAGFNLFFQDHKSILTYPDAKSLAEKIKWFQTNRKEASRIATDGQNITNHYFNFDARRKDLFNLLNQGETLDVFRLNDEPRCRIRSSTPENQNATMRRIQIYEVAQELHRTLETPHVLLTAGVTPFIAADLADLFRLKQSIAVDEESFVSKVHSLLEKMQVKNLSRIDPESIPSHSCDLIIVSLNELNAIIPILQKRHRSICIWDFDPSNKTMHSQLLDSGYEPSAKAIQGLFKCKLL